MTTVARLTFESVIMQAYDYNGVEGVTAQPDTAYWANGVPEPASMLVMGVELAGSGSRAAPQEFSENEPNLTDTSEFGSNERRSRAPLTFLQLYSAAGR